jgi:hypothetical protein
MEPSAPPKQRKHRRAKPLFLRHDDHPNSPRGKDGAQKCDRRLRNRIATFIQLSRCFRTFHTGRTVLGFAALESRQASQPRTRA